MPAPAFCLLVPSLCPRREDPHTFRPIRSHTHPPIRRIERVTHQLSYSGFELNLPITLRLPVRPFRPPLPLPLPKFLVSVPRSLDRTVRLEL